MIRSGGACHGTELGDGSALTTGAVDLDVALHEILRIELKFEDEGQWGFRLWVEEGRYFCSCAFIAASECWDG